MRIRSYEPGGRSQSKTLGDCIIDSPSSEVLLDDAMAIAPAI
jgi:hypothetical protein